MPRFVIEFTDQDEMSDFLSASDKGSIERPSITLVNETGQTLALTPKVEGDVLHIEVRDRTALAKDDVAAEALPPGASFQLS